MNLQKIEEIWQLLETVGTGPTETNVHAVGISSAGREICLGRDIDGRRHLLVPLPTDRPEVAIFRSRGLLVRKRPLLKDGVQGNYLDLICLIPDLNEIFSRLILEVLQSMQPQEPKAVEKCFRILEQWKELFGVGSATLDRQQAIGLLGELIVLERLALVNAEVVGCWTGPIGGIHDFRFGKRALEVKTSTRRYGRIVTINGQQQLAPPAEGDLHLAVLKLSESPGGSYSLPTVIQSIRRHGVDPLAFGRCLAESGYVAGEIADIESLRFDLDDAAFFEVDDSFPRIIDQSFVSGAVPPGIVKITYEIDLTGPVPKPLSEPSSADLIESLALGVSK